MATPDTLPDSLPLRGHAERAFEDYLQQIEEPLFRVVLRHVDGNQSRAADILGIHRATLRRKLRDLGLS